MARVAYDLLRADARSKQGAAPESFDDVLLVLGEVSIYV